MLNTNRQTLRLLQRAHSQLDELNHRISAAEEREQREQREAKARADDAAYLVSRDHMLDVDAAKRNAQVRADDALQSWGLRAPPSVDGESVKRYRRRLLHQAQPRLPDEHKLRRLDFLNSEKMPWDVLERLEPLVYADVAEAGRRNDSAAPGELREVVQMDPKNGQKMHLFYGRESFVKRLGRPGRRVKSFLFDRTALRG
jgi:hypothetical protein